MRKGKHLINIQFKWKVGEVVTVPCLSNTAIATIMERRFVETKNGSAI